MAAPITHLVLAQEFLGRYRLPEPQADFLVGACFPDIRYLGVIDRTATHNADPSLATVLRASSSFEAGHEHHSLIDRVRNDLFAAGKIYDQAPQSPLLTNAFKFFEDEITYGLQSDWGAIAAAFADVPPAELSYSIKPTDLRRWHDGLIAYMSAPPTTASRRDLMAVARFPETSRIEVERVMNLLRTDQTIIDLIKNIYSDFTSNLR